MADITVTVPDDKVQLVKDMVLSRTSEPDLTNAEIVDWVEAYFINILRRLVREYQKGLYDATFVFDDPVPPVE